MEHHQEPSLGARIRQIRIELHLSQEELALEMGLKSKVSISDWELNKTKPDLNQIRYLVDRGGKTLDWIVYGRERASSVVPEPITIRSTIKSRHKRVSKVQVVNFVSAGGGGFDDVPVDEEFELPLDLSDKVIALRVSGNSMDPEYRDKDYIFVEEVPVHAIRNNRDYALILEEDTTVKRVRKHLQGYELIPLNLDADKSRVVQYIRRAFIVRGVFRYF